MVGGTGRDTFVLHAANGYDIITDFTAGTNTLRFADETAAQVSWKAASQSGYNGVQVNHGSTWAFLAGVNTLTAADLVFG